MHSCMRLHPTQVPHTTKDPCRKPPPHSHMHPPQVMVPKLIHPLPPTTPRQPHSPTLAGEEIIEDPPTPHPSSGDMWMQVGWRSWNGVGVILVGRVHAACG